MSRIIPLLMRLDALELRLDAAKRKCNTGYACGSTCISVQKECRKEAQSSLSKERAERLAQLSQGKLRTRGIGGLKPEEAAQRALEIRKFQRTGHKPAWFVETPAPGAARKASADELDVSTADARLAFVKRIRERSISRPGASYTGNSLATATLALCDEPGEVGRNARRMAKFLATSNVLTVVDQIRPDLQPNQRGPVREADVKHLLSKDVIAKVQGNEERLSRVLEAINYNKEQIKLSKKNKETIKKGMEEDQRMGWDTPDRVEQDRERLKFHDDNIKSNKSGLETCYRTLGIMLMGTPDAAGLAGRGGILRMRDDAGRDVPWSSDGLDAKRLQQATQAQVSTYGNHGAKAGYTTAGAPGLRRNEQVMSAFIHEVGHMVHFASGDARNTVVKLPPTLESALTSARPSILRSGVPAVDSVLVGDNRFFVSDYSTTNRLELFAESFVAFVVAPQQLRERSPEVYSWVDDVLSRANANPVVKPTVAP
jgi:hypothetical protein